MQSRQAIIAQLRIDFPASITYASHREGGQVFINHNPEVNKENKEFVIIRKADGKNGRFGVEVTPCDEIERGYKVLDDISKIADWAIELGVGIFKPRGFYGRVKEGLEPTSLLKQPFEGCRYGRWIKIQIDGDGEPEEASVLLASSVSFEADTLIETKKAKGSVLLVGPTDFEEKATEYDGFASFIEDFLKSPKQRFANSSYRPLQPKKQKQIVGLWMGDPIQDPGNRGQLCLRDTVMILDADGNETEQVAVVYFNRDDKLNEPIPRGKTVRIWVQGQNTFGVMPTKEKASVELYPENVPFLLGAYLAPPNIKMRGNIEITRSHNS